MRIRTCPILDKLSKDGTEVAVTCRCMDYSGDSFVKAKASVRV